MLFFHTCPPTKIYFALYSPTEHNPTSYEIITLTLQPCPTNFILLPNLLLRHKLECTGCIRQTSSIASSLKPTPSHAFHAQPPTSLLHDRTLQSPHQVTHISKRHPDSWHPRKKPLTSPQHQAPTELQHTAFAHLSLQPPPPCPTTPTRPSWTKQTQTSTPAAAGKGAAPPAPRPSR